MILFLLLMFTYAQPVGTRSRRSATMRTPPLPSAFASWRRNVSIFASAFGCAAAVAFGSPPLSPSSRAPFGVQWTAYMLFMALVGGLGTSKGRSSAPSYSWSWKITRRDRGWFSSVSASASLVSLLLPRGLWGRSKIVMEFSSCRRLSAAARTADRIDGESNDKPGWWRGCAAFRAWIVGPPSASEARIALRMGRA